MFPLTRPRRQVLATLVLLLGTVAPTVYVASIAWRIRQAGHLRNVELEIGRALGLHASLDAVRYPRPGEVIYRGIVLRQEEPRRRGLTEVARARSIRLRRSGRELILETEGLRLRGESPRLAMAQIGVMLQRPLDGTFDRVSFSAPTCDLDLGRDGLHHELRELAGTFQADRTSPNVRVSYRLASRGSNTRCELILTRDRKAEPVRTSVVMKTMEGLPLPARVLDTFFDSAEWLGPEARVEGTLALHQTGAKDWEADFQGDLIDVDLGTLVGRRFPSHRLSGIARVAVKSARWGERAGQGTGWIEARGALTTGQGTMGLSLLEALESEMHLRLARPRIAKLTTPRDEVEFRAIGLTFAITGDGEIRLDGGLGNEFAPDVVLAGRTSPLAYAPRGAANVRGLIKTLIPSNPSDPTLMVPLTAESRVLLCLPAPAAAVEKGIDGN